MELSPDFLDYFQTLYPLLVYDKTLWCISAWNDNGIDKKIAREPSKTKNEYKNFYFFVFKALLHRTDFFPGLGWLLTKNIWNEIKANWPAGYMKIFFR